MAKRATYEFAYQYTEGNTYAPWLDKSKKAIKLPEENAAEGSFKVTAQELSIAAEATIQLTLVIVEQDPKQMEIGKSPYLTP